MSYVKMLLVYKKKEELTFGLYPISHILGKFSALWKNLLAFSTVSVIPAALKPLKAKLLQLCRCMYLCKIPLA